MENLISETEKFAVELLNNKLDNTFVYHNLAHTQRVVKKTKELTEESDIADTEKQQLIIASWFHDTGFTKTIEDHETESVMIASEFLKSNDIF